AFRRDRRGADDARLLSLGRRLLLRGELSLEPLLRLGGEARLARFLLGLKPCDLALDRLDQPAALGETGLDLLLRRRTLGDDLLLASLRALQERGADDDVVLELLDLPDDLCVLRGDAVRGLDSVEELGQAVRAEENRERRVVLLLGVEGTQPQPQAALRDRQVALRDLQVARVQRAFGLDPGEVVSRAVVGLDRALELGVEGLDLAEDPLSLGALRRDRGRLAGRRAGEHDGSPEA